MIARTGTILGRGVYGVAEAARYARLQPARVRWWFRHRTGRRARPLLASDYGAIGGTIALSFLDLVDVCVAGRLRSLGVPMPVVRAAYDVLRRDYPEHPFARQDLYSDGQRIFVRTASELAEETLAEVVSGQHFFPHIKELLTRIEYNPDTGMAVRWHVAEGVTIDPGVSLGKPVVQHTGVTTFVLWRQYRANRGNSALVADLYGVSPADVERAVEFERNLERRRAA